MGFIRADHPTRRTVGRKKKLLPLPTPEATWTIHGEESESIEFGRMGLIRLAAPSDATSGNAHGFDAHS